jgi:hypothetical protein
MKISAHLLENVTYETIIHLADTASPTDLTKMLNRVSRTLPILEKSSIYSKVEADIRSNHASIRDDIASIVKDGLAPNVDSNLMVWIIGLRTALEFHDFNALHLQMCMFVVSQRENVFRIEDDKLRLITTYFHFSLAGHLIAKGII